MPDAGGYDCGFLDDAVQEGRVSFEESRREGFSRDASSKPASVPDAVAWPADAEEAAAVLAAANERGVPVTPWSGGSGLEGNAIPVEGGVVLSTYRMDGVEVRPEDLVAVAGPGVVYDDLNDRLGRHGLRFPPGISSGDVATVGGMVATNASGFNSVRYGETRDHVRRLEVALADGRLIEAGSDAAKTSSGYSLKDLFVGSEGTLGVITEAALSLSGIPAEKRAALVTFPTSTDACRAVSELVRYGLRPGALEFMGPTAIDLINGYTDGARLPVEPTLIVELHGSADAVAEDVAFARSICEEEGATTWESPEDPAEVWRARRDAYPAARAHREGWDVAMTGDVVVPISKYPEIVDRVGEAAADLDLLAPCVGHAGDGNLHYTPLVDPDDPGMVARAEELNDRVVRAALALGGTATGEHGVGMGKRRFMREEHGDGVDVMRAIKRALDSNGILNPGKVLPGESTSAR